VLEIEVGGLNNLLDALAQTGHQVQPGSPALEGALDVVAKRTQDAKAREIAKTYARPIPRNGKGKPKWERKGNFAGDLTTESTPGERQVLNRGESEKYERRLALLDESSDGVDRSNAAAEYAYDKVEPQLAALFEQELLNKFNY
jgi:hypothetical protein